MATSVLNLFPSRVPFGYATIGGKSVPVLMAPEFARALDQLFRTTTGEENTFTDVFMRPESDGDGLVPEFMQTAPQEVALPELIQQAGAEAAIPEFFQPGSGEIHLPEVMQPVDTRSMSPVEAVTPGASPYTYTAGRDGYLTVQGGTVSKIEYVRRGAATDTGVTAGMFPILVGDGLTVTYTVAPTVTFIPR